jgi:hypothetical protein
MLNSFSDLSAGVFVHFECRTTQPQKPKFAFVGAVESDRAIVFLVNSLLTEFITSRSDLLAQQIPLTHTDYPEFLAYDSWLDCSSAHIVSTEDLVSIEIKAIAAAVHVHQIAQVVEVSKTLNRRVKATVAVALSPPQ